MRASGGVVNGAADIDAMGISGGGSIAQPAWTGGMPTMPAPIGSGNRLPTCLSLHHKSFGAEPLLCAHLLCAHSHVLLARCRRGDVIVDFCCGTAHLGLAVAYFFPSCTVVGVDMQRKSLDIGACVRVCGTVYNVTAVVTTHAVSPLLAAQTRASAAGITNFTVVHGLVHGTWPAKVYAGRTACVTERSGFLLCRVQGGFQRRHVAPCMW